MAKTMKKLKKEFAIKKTNQIITISNGDITATQKKAYNILLHKALLDLKADNSQECFAIRITEIEEKAGIQDSIKECLESLMKISIKYIEDKNTNWGSFVLLRQVSIEDGLLKYEFPDIIRTALINNDYQTIVDLVVIKTLKCKYALILYEMAIKYSKIEIPKFTIEEFKILTGAETYRDFRELKINVIEPAISEINEKSDINISYETFIEGRKIKEIKFHIKQNPSLSI